jgi:hypothetical protein
LPASKSVRNPIGMANSQSFAALNQIQADSGIPRRVEISESWYYTVSG